MVPHRPESSRHGWTKKKGQENRLVEKIDELIQHLEEVREEHRKEKERLEEEIEWLRKGKNVFEVS